MNMHQNEPIELAAATISQDDLLMMYKFADPSVRTDQI